MTTLSDIDIHKAMSNELLIKNGIPAQVGPACYELRMGNIYYDLTESDKRIDASEYHSILIKPGHRVVLITHEELVIPADIIARVISKGSLFSVGLSPVCTYADPGFYGNIGIVTQNISDKYIEIPIGESIAKVDFSILTSKVNKSYQGQHGFQTQIWPVKHQLQKTYKQIKSDPRVNSELEESYKILPQATVKILRKLQMKQRNIDIGILFSILINGLVLAAVSTKFLDFTVAIVINIISTAIVGLLIWIARDKEF